VTNGASRPAAHLPRVAAAALALAVLAHCGRKTDVRPPELVAPEVVEGLRTQNVAEGVRVSWRRPTRYVDGSTMTDLGGFRIERSRDGEAFGLWREEPVNDRERFRKTRRFRVVDTGVETGREYRYRVRAFTLDGHVSHASEVAGIVRQQPADEKSTDDRRDEPQ
jgi:hypothetical protein